MHPDLERLSQLSHVDTEIDRVDRDLKAARTTFEQTQAAELEAMRARDALQAELSTARTEERALQRQLEEYRDRQQKATRILETGAGSADAAERQFAQCSALIDRTETTMLGLMERLDELAARLDRAETELAKIGCTRRDLEQSMPSRVEALRHERGALEIQRDSLRSALPRDLGDRYDMLRSSKRRTAVAQVREETCVGCQHVVAQQRITDIKRGLIVECNGCGRWLVV